MSYLDAGCAKGLHALREQKLEKRGLDHCGWAVEHSLASARPFLELASPDVVAVDRSVDVLAAISLLGTLTEEQIRRFLPRAKRGAPSLFCNNSKAGQQRDRDLSQITMGDRQCGASAS
jgi:hypothetical protein